MRLRAAPIMAAIITFCILTIVEVTAPYPMLTADRFLRGSGWVEILLLAVYAAFVVRALVVGPDTSRIRLTIWLAFSTVFFTSSSWE